ncbi:MAG: hypothetical protein WA005_12325 [Candidatus Binataceae bacterium]
MHFSPPRSRRSKRLAAILFAASILTATAAFAADTGQLKLDVLGDIGKGAKSEAEVVAGDGTRAATVAPGASVALKPGDYKIVIPILGGSITKQAKVEAGRTSTVLVTNVAVLRVKVKDRDGRDPGFTVTVSGASPPHQTLTTMVSGDSILCAPNAVDVKVDAPPQGYYWHAVELTPGQVTELTLNERVPAELVVQPVMSHAAMDEATRVVIYKGGTQAQVAVSEPGPEHRFKLDPGDYDVYVENHSGRGKPYLTERGVHLDSGAKVTRQEPLDGGTAN